MSRRRRFRILGGVQCSANFSAPGRQPRIVARVNDSWPIAAPTGAVLFRSSRETVRKYYELTEAVSYSSTRESWREHYPSEEAASYRRSYRENYRTADAVAHRSSRVS